MRLVIVLRDNAGIILHNFKVIPAFRPLRLCDHFAKLSLVDFAKLHIRLRRFRHRMLVVEVCDSVDTYSKLTIGTDGRVVSFGDNSIDFYSHPTYTYNICTYMRISIIY